jgi:hypothetical protein
MPRTPYADRRPPDRSAAHRGRRSTEGPWFVALRMLHSRGWSDREISEALVDLSAEAIGWLTRTERWKETDKMLAPDSGEPWTRRQVEYWRRRLGLPGKRHRHDCGSQGRPYQVAQHLRAVAAGWGHLGPLSAGELAVVEALSGGAVMTRRSLERETGYRLAWLTAGRRHPLRRLRDRGLVVVAGGGYGGRAPLYALSPDVTRRGESGDASGLLRLAARIAARN